MNIFFINLEFKPFFQMLVNNSFHIFKLYECIPFSHSLNIIKKNVMSENIGALKIKYRQTSDNMLLRSKG